MEKYPDKFKFSKIRGPRQERIYDGPEPEIEDVYNGPDPDIISGVYAGPDQGNMNDVYAPPEMMGMGMGSAVNAAVAGKAAKAPAADPGQKKEDVPEPDDAPIECVYAGPGMMGGRFGRKR